MMSSVFQVRRRSRGRCLLRAALWVVLVLVVGLVLAGMGFLPSFGPGPANTLNGAQVPNDRPQAPDLTGGVAWLNTDHPLKLADLRGRVVLLDFWTLC